MNHGTKRGWVVSNTPRPHFIPKKDPVPRRLCGPKSRSGRAENLVPTGIRSRTVQPVISHYTDWATRPTIFLKHFYYSYLMIALCGRNTLYVWKNKTINCVVLDGFYIILFIIVTSGFLKYSWERCGRKWSWTDLMQFDNIFRDKL